MIGVSETYSGQIDKLITVATPNYGVENLQGLLNINNALPDAVAGPCSVTQATELLFGSEFIANLHDAWYAGAKGFQAPSGLYIVGTNGACTAGTRELCTDGLVDIWSAVLPDATDVQIRYVPRQHVNDIAYIDSNPNSTHETLRLVDSFLKTGYAITQAEIGFQAPSGAQSMGMLTLRRTLQSFPNVDDNSVVLHSSSPDENSATHYITYLGVEDGVYTISMTKGHNAASQYTYIVSPGRPTMSRLYQ